MDSGFKLMVFCLVALFAIATYQDSVGVARKSNVASAASGKASITKAAPTKGRSAAASASRTKTTGVIKQIIAKQGNIPAPKAGQSYALGYLFNLINTNNPDKDNPEKCSAFLIYFDNPSRSASGKDYGFDKAWMDSNKDLQVVLSADPGLIQKMVEVGAFPDASKIPTYKAVGWADVFSYVMDKFPKLLLYFTAVSPKDGQTYKLYIIDPWPQNGGISINPNLKPEQACRAYRLLMDWKVE